jgi:hypothetical protein
MVNTRKKDVSKFINYERHNTRKGYYRKLIDCTLDKNKGYMITNNKFINKRHKFDQLYYHAGDWVDIERYGMLRTRIDTKITKHAINNTLTSPQFNNYDINSIYNTFDYLFNHMKKGIYVKIYNNKLHTFLPFSNANWTNPNWHRLHINNADKALLKRLNNKPEKRLIPGIINELSNNVKTLSDKYKTRPFDSNRKQWVNNNCNIRNFAQGNIEGDINHHVFKHMLEKMCLNCKKLPNAEMFLNVRDFPMLNKKYLEPYDELYDDVHFKSFIPRKYQNTMCPILSCSVTSEYSDLLMPNSDDWVRASRDYYLAYKDPCFTGKRHTIKSTPEITKLLKNKINKVIFRGSATGCSADINVNIRLIAAKIGYENESIFDIGITDWNARPKRSKNNPVLIIEPNSFPFNLKTKISDEEKFKYRYILNLDGHVSAFRLGGELKSGSVVFLPKSKYKLWFSDLLEEYIHYIPLKEDLSDLKTQYEWCENNLDKCQIITKNARGLHAEISTQKGMISHMEKVVHGVASLRNIQFIPTIVAPKSVAIITIYRNDTNNTRSEQKDFFIHSMSQLFPSADIFIIEQSNDSELFNIGKLKNIGFILAKQKRTYDHYVITDIDMIPDTRLSKYYVNSPPINTVMALAIEGTRYENRKNLSIASESTKPFLGGVCSFNSIDFEKINGFPVNFIGWGGEDNALAYKLSKHNVYVGYPKVGGVIDSEEHNNNLIGVKDKVQKHLKDQKDNLQYEKLFNITKDNGLNNTNFKVLKTLQINDKCKQIVVDLMTNEDKTAFPHWFPTAMSDDDLKKFHAHFMAKNKNYKWKVKYI